MLREISFDLQAGEIVAVLGPNGAGKSTLLKALNGGLIPDGGEILLEGSKLDTYSRRQMARRVAVVAQENETKFPVTVLEFVLSGRFARGGAFGWESDEDHKIAEHALADCDLQDYGARTMNELSGGERQRVVLARALATEAKLLLLDEPTANLDISHQALMFRLIGARCSNGGNSSVVITHDLNLAAAFADKIILLNKGKIFAIGLPASVLTESNIREVFAVNAILDMNPTSGHIRVTAIY